MGSLGSGHQSCFLNDKIKKKRVKELRGAECSHPDQLLAQLFQHLAQISLQPGRQLCTRFIYLFFYFSFSAHLHFLAEDVAAQETLLPAEDSRPH